MLHPYPGYRHTPPLTPDERNAWRSVLYLAEEKRWKPKAEVFRPGCCVQGLHYIVSGQLRTVAIGSSGLQRVLWIMEEDNFFGEIAMFSGKPCIHFMETLTESVTFFFPAAVLNERIIPDVPLIGQSLLRILAEKIRQQSADIQAKTFFTAHTLIASFLLERMPLHCTQGCLIRISHAELADLLGLHRVTVTKSLARMKKNGLLRNTHEGIVVEDPAGLEQILHS